MQVESIVARFRRGFTAAKARHIVSKGSQKTKVRCIVSLLGFAGNTLMSSNIAQASDTARANYFDILVKPFSKIDLLHFDIAMYQDGASVSPDGFIDWALWKSPAGAVGSGTMTPDGSGIANVPYIFKTGRAAVPMLSATGMPTIYHLSGDIKIPPRFRIMAPGDFLILSVKASPAGAGLSYSVNGTVTYMFKV